MTFAAIECRRSAARRVPNPKVAGFNPVPASSLKGSTKQEEVDRERALA